MNKNRKKVQPKIDAVLEILKSINLEYTEIKYGIGDYSSTYYSGETSGSIKNKLLVARRMLLEIGKEV